ncbi:MAG: VIT1/CCC1 transporter family protein [Candidatus Woesearchaeota archaeon]
MAKLTVKKSGKKTVDLSSIINSNNANTPEAHIKQGPYLKSAVYGGLDGIITTFAIVAGVAGAALSSNVVIILGFANLIADGLSMAVGDYLSRKAESEYHVAEKERESWEIKHYPNGEKREMEQIYVKKGISKSDSKKMVSILSKYPEAWLDEMMLKELNITEQTESPINNAFVTFFSFLIFGFIPLFFYIINLFSSINFNSFFAASLFTGLTLFLLGSLKAKITQRNWFKSGSEMLIVGSIAAMAAYFIGYTLQMLL